MRKFIVIAFVMCLAVLLILQMPDKSTAQGGVPEEYLQRAANHLSGQLGITVDLTRYAWTWEENVWATPAMGCPDPTQTYEQINTRGYEINFYIDDVQHRYFVNSVSLIYCVDGVPHPSSTILVVPTATPVPPDFTPSPLPTLEVTPTATPSPTITPTVNPDFPEVMTDPTTDWEPITKVFDEVDGVEMVLVPAGCFLMGSNQGDTDERPVHEYCFREPYWIDTTEVTRAMYETCLEDGACTETLESDFSDSDTQPMNRVTWFQAVDYCEWREARLPTEAEWEFAARGPQSLVYPWGNDFNPDAVVYAANAGGVTADVGSIADGASWVGVYDLSGNVWEWTSTIYLSSDFPYPYDADDGREDPDDEERSRVIRGGSFFVDDAFELRSSFRNFLEPDNGEDGTVGFRCARDFALEDLEDEETVPTGTPGSTAACEPEMPARLSPGDRGVIDDEGDTDSLNVRDDIGLTGTTVIGSYPVLTEFSVLAGPVCDEDNNAWYQIRIDEDDVEGWVIEALDEDYTIRPVNSARG